MRSKNELFNTVKEAEEHAAWQVASFWLASAYRILERGEKPLRLTKCALTLSQDEIDRDMYHPLSRSMSVANIARSAIQVALSKLRMGQFPKVREHFEIESDIDSSKFARICLIRNGEIDQ